MTTDGREIKLYEALVSAYGIEAQEKKFLEELAELNHAYWEFHKDRGNEEKEKHFIRELVDADLMIKQMAAFHDWDYFWSYRETKLRNLPEKLRTSALKNSNVRFILERFYAEYLEVKEREPEKEEQMAEDWKPVNNY